MKMSLCAFPQVRIFEDYDKMSAKEVYFNEAGNKITVKLLHFPDVPPEDMHKIKFDDALTSTTATTTATITTITDNHCNVEGLEQALEVIEDDVESLALEQNEEIDETDVDEEISINMLENQDAKRVIRKKSGGSSFAHMRKCSFAFAQAHGLKNAIMPITPTINIPFGKTMPINYARRGQHQTHCINSSNNLCPGYAQYSKSLLEVPLPRDYGYASSDDLSSEWESDVPPSTAKAKKVCVLTSYYVHVIVNHFMLINVTTTFIHKIL